MRKDDKKYALMIGLHGDVKYWDGHEFVYDEDFAIRYTKEDAMARRDSFHGRDVYVVILDN
jgi:hypothetical protein